MKNSTRTILAVLLMLLTIGTAPGAYSQVGWNDCTLIEGTISAIDEDICRITVKVSDEETYDIYGMKLDWLERKEEVELSVDDYVIVTAQYRGTADKLVACFITICRDDDGDDPTCEKPETPREEVTLHNCCLPE